jgi:hypothetical protein
MLAEKREDFASGQSFEEVADERMGAGEFNGGRSVLMSMPSRSMRSLEKLTTQRVSQKLCPS